MAGGKEAVQKGVGIKFVEGAQPLWSNDGGVDDIFLVNQGVVGEESSDGLFCHLSGMVIDDIALTGEEAAVEALNGGG